MLARTICTISLAYAFMPMGEVAGDVAYRLDTHALTPKDESKVLNLEGLELRDSVWAAPGIEQASNDLDPPQKCDWMRPTRVHIVRTSASTRMTYHGPTAGPVWLDEVALP